MGRLGEIGISIYFRNNRMNIHRRAIYAIGKPSYIHLLFDRERMTLGVQSCERDRDAFRVTYKKGREAATNCYVNSKLLIAYFARIMGVSTMSDSMLFPGVVLDDGITIQVDLRKYEIIPTLQSEGEIRNGGDTKSISS